MKAEKLLIGNKKFVGNKNADNYIEVDLMLTIESIKRDSVENVFDFQQQYDLERNNSLKFCLYGMVESRYGHCDNLAINIKVGDTNKSGMTNDVIFQPIKGDVGTLINSGFTITTITSPLNIHGNNSNLSLSKNIYGAAKSSYFILFELDKNILESKQNKSIFLEIYDPIRELFNKHSFPLIYFDSDGEFIKFGTENAEINNDNEIVEINNNFPFFYDRHWIRNNFEVMGPQKVFFTTGTTTVTETTINPIINVSLFKPSIYGLEKVKIVIDFGTDIYGNILTTAEFGADFNFTEPVLTWDIGEQTKSFYVSIINDLVVETIEKITFRIIPISNVIIDSETQYKTVLSIESDDIPVRANFDQLNTVVYEPDFITATTNSYQVNIVLSQPVTIPNQKIGLKIVSNETTALYGDNYIIDTGVNSTQITEPRLIEFAQGQSVFSFNIIINGNHTYDVDKFITLELFPDTNSPNIVVGNQLPKLKITIKDNMTYKYVRYTIPIDESRGIGVFRTIYGGGNYYQTFTSDMEIGIPNTSLGYGTPQVKMTKMFSCDLIVKNLGERIVWNNQLVNYSQTITIPLDFSGATSNISFDLPTNFNLDIFTNSYKQSKYQISFDNFSKFVVQNYSSGIELANSYKKYLDAQILDGGDLGTKQYFLISEISNVNDSFDPNGNPKCLTAPTVFNQSGIKYFGGIFPVNRPPNLNNGTPHTDSTLSFTTKKIQVNCHYVPGNTLLPTGYNFVPEPPYSDKIANLNLGQIFVQAGYLLSTAGIDQRIKFAAYNSPVTNWQFFRDWSSTHPDTKDSIELEITNEGDIDVQFEGKDLYINYPTVFKSTDLNFSNLQLSFPANEIYDSASNGFTNVRYRIKIKNVKIYNSNTYSNQSLSLDLGLFNKAADVRLSAPQYYVESIANNVYLAGDIFGHVTFNFSIFNPNSPLSIRIVKTNNLLFFGNTASFQSTVHITDQPIIPTTITGIYPHTIELEII